MADFTDLQTASGDRNVVFNQEIFNIKSVVQEMKGGGDKLEVYYADDGGLKARYQKTGKEPIQVPARWYGWYFTYPETDVYAYALVIWEVLTGDIPWRGLNPVQVAMQILTKQARPAVPEGAPADLVALMQRCWAHEPGARPKFAAIKAELLGSGPATPAK